MSLDEPLRAIACALAGPDGRRSPIGPGRWHVLFGNRSRPLLMPAGAYRLQQQGLRYFIGGRLKTLYAKSLLAANSLLPAARLLPEFRMPFGGRGAFAGGLPIGGPPQAAIQIGTVGPYQKASMLLMAENGEALALAKLAMVRSADSMVLAEGHWLRTLEGMSAIAGQVPRLITRGTVPNGRHYLVTTLAPGTSVTHAFTPAHAHFLRALGRSRLEATDFNNSSCLTNLQGAICLLEPHVERAAAAVLRSALLDCQRVLRGWRGPFVVAQGDFAPWNIRLHGRGIFVFDWEYARNAANPLSDTLNYLLIPRALSGRSIGSRFLAKVMRQATDVAEQLYPEWQWRARDVSAFTLAYLLEVLLCYSTSQRRLDRTHPVIKSYWHLLRWRGQWLAQI